MLAVYVCQSLFCDLTTCQTQDGQRILVKVMAVPGLQLCKPRDFLLLGNLRQMKGWLRHLRWMSLISWRAGSSREISCHVRRIYLILMLALLDAKHQKHLTPWESALCKIFTKFCARAVCDKICAEYQTCPEKTPHYSLFNWNTYRRW